MTRETMLKKLTNETITLLKNCLSAEVFDYEIILSQLNKAMDIGSTKYHYTSYLSSKSKKVEQLDSFGNVIEPFDSISAAARKLNISHVAISKVCRGKMHTAGGFIWKYKT